MLLKARQGQVLVRSCVFFDLPTVELPEYAYEYLPWAAGRERVLKDQVDIVGFSIFPEIIEPSTCAFHDRAVIPAHIEFKVLGQACGSQIRGADNDSLFSIRDILGWSDQIGLGMHECLLIPLDFEIAGP